MKSAVFGQEFKQFNQSYKEEFIQSICNKSGIFIKEFREIKEDPYAREEFIMSISMKSAKFDKIDNEAEFEQFHQAIQETIDKPAAAKKIADRKKHLLYEMELKEKMRNIKRN